jgi:hypothetical protein
MKLEFSQWIFKKYITQTPWKSIQRDLRHVDGWTDTTKLTVASSKYVNANNNSAVKVKVKQSCNRLGVAHRIPGGLGSQIS